MDSAHMVWSGYQRRYCGVCYHPATDLVEAGAGPRLVSPVKPTRLRSHEIGRLARLGAICRTS
jgi:hypothetical protein